MITDCGVVVSTRPDSGAQATIFAGGRYDQSSAAIGKMTDFANRSR